MGRIAEESIQQVIAACDIVDVVSGYFPLKRAGSSWKACCPFHSERTPSFHVNPARNTWHCFGCSRGGSAVGFVMEYEGLSFPEAVRKLAAKYNITLVETAGPGDGGAAASQRSRLLAVHRDAAIWFHALLMRSPQAAPAREYLKGRGLNADVAKRWQIGYAPDSRAAYNEWASAAGYDEAILVEAGLLSLREERLPHRETYVRFRHRVMFPVRNDHGDVIAFSGRILDPGSSPAKYMNSPATPIFNKSAVFFGLDRSKRAIHQAQCAVVCEGQIDMIMCFEAGITNIVAPLGTAFTEAHARILKRHADQVILCYDADEAGRKAVQRCFAELSREGIHVRVAALPPGEDPDSLLRSEGPAAFQERLAKAQDYFDFELAVHQPRLATGDVRERIRVMSELAAGLARIRDNVVLDEALQRVALRLNVPPAELRRMVEAHIRQFRRQEQVRASADRGRAGEGEDAIPPEPPVRLENNALRLLLQLSLTDAGARRTIAAPDSARSWEGIPGGDLLDRAIAAPVDPGQPATVTAWLSSLSPAEQALVTAILHAPVPAGLAPEESAKHALISLRAATVRSRIDLLKLRIRSAAADGLSATTELMALQKEFLDLQERLRNIPLMR